MYSAVQAGVPAAVIFGEEFWRDWGEGQERRKDRENSVVYIPLQVARRDYFEFLTLSMRLSTERMAFVDEICLCGDRKHHVHAKESVLVTYVYQ